MKAAYRNVLEEKGQSIRVFVFEDKEFPAAWHSHPQYELTFIASSSGMRYIGDHIHNFTSGDLVLVGTNLPHSWKTVGEQQSLVKAIIIQFSEDFLGTNWLDKFEFSQIKQLLTLSARGIQFSDATAKALAPTLLQLPEKSAFDKVIGLVQILQTLAQKKEHQLLSTAGFNTSITGEDSKRISTVLTYVKNNVQSKIAISMVASLVGLTEVSFCRYFKKVHNKPFIAFLNEFRIALACKLLIETDLTVSEIGYECGFGSITLLHRLFKKKHFMTPLDYRNQYRSIPTTSKK